VPHWLYAVLVMIKESWIIVHEADKPIPESKVPDNVNFRSFSGRKSFLIKPFRPTISVSKFLYREGNMMQFSSTHNFSQLPEKEYQHV
jgi:hypothetical protein